MRQPGTRSLLLVSSVVAAALLWPQPSSAQTAGGEVVVDAGALRAVVHADPWRLDFVDEAGRSVLSEATGTGLGPNGSLGFRTPAGWRHATQLLSERRAAGQYRAVLATTDPQRRIEVRLTQDAEGVVGLDARVTGASTADVEALGMGFQASDDERFLGLGERSGRVDHRGQVVENFVSDGPYQTEEYPFLNAFVPPWGLRQRSDATYFPVPWLLSSEGFGVLVDNPETSYFRLGTEDAQEWSVEVQAAPLGQPGAATAPPPDRLQLRVFAGPEPADALRRFTRDTGRQPTPQPWTFGPWFQAKGDELAQVQLLQEADAPLSVLQTYLHYLPCGDQQGIEQDQPERTAAAHRAGVAITTYFNPMVCANYQSAFVQARDSGALTRDGTGEPYLYRYGARPQDSNLVGQYDFFTEAGEQAYGDLLAEAIDDGYDGWMEDFGEYTPLDSVSGDGIAGSRAHNPYVTRYHCAAFEQTRQRSDRIVRYQRSGWTGSAACADVVWGGDPTTGWGFDGLRSTVHQALSMGTSGVSTWGSDIGGFFALGRNALTPELLTRWVQLGAVSPVMRTQANGVALPEKSRPQVTDADQLPNWRRYSKLHTQLYPYLRAAQSDYERTGMPIVAHLLLVDPADRQAAEREDQFMFGPDLLAAPVLDPGAREREAYLPRGQWVDLWRAVDYQPDTGGPVLRQARPTPGERSVTVPAPLEELPLFVRAGAVLPLLSPDVDSLTSYDGGPGVVRLADRLDRLHLLAFPRGRSESRFYESERLVSAESPGRWTLEVQGQQQRTVVMQASLATLETPFEPCRVALDGRDLPGAAWTYRQADQALDVTFEAAAAVLEVSACPGAGRSAAAPVTAGADDVASSASPASSDSDARRLPSTGTSGLAALAALALFATAAGLRRVNQAGSAREPATPIEPC